MSINIPAAIKYLLDADVQNFVQAYYETVDASILPPELATLFTTPMTQIQLINYPLLFDVTNKSSLHYAVAGGQDPDFCACFDPLITRADSFGMTALMLAAKLHNSAWLEYLVADEHACTDCFGRTALIYAISSPLPCDMGLRFQQVQFLFDFEWAYLDAAGRTCVDYARECLPEEYAGTLERTFVQNCWAYGTPRGVKITDQAAVELRLSGSGQGALGHSVLVQSVFSEIYSLRSELYQRKHTINSESLEALHGYMEELQSENERLKKDAESQQMRAVQLKQIAEQKEKEKSVILDEMQIMKAEIAEERERMLSYQNKINSALNSTADLKVQFYQKETLIKTLYKDKNYLQKDVYRVSVENQHRSEYMMQLNSVLNISPTMTRRTSESFYKSEPSVLLNITAPKRSETQTASQNNFAPTPAYRKRLAMQQRIKQSLDLIGALESVEV